MPAVLADLALQDVDAHERAKCCSCGVDVQIAHFVGGDVAVRHVEPECARFKAAVQSAVGIHLYALNCERKAGAR